MYLKSTTKTLCFFVIPWLNLLSNPHNPTFCIN